MRLGDVERSRAVLIGASSYTSLTDLPAVRQNLIDLQQLLTHPTVWGLPRSHCIALSDENSAELILDVVHEAAEAATDTLLVYYAGHGLLDQAMDLHLALPASDSRRMYKSLQYDHIRQELRDAVHCPSKVVILDCCFSGRAARGRMGRTADIADQAAVEGSWLVAASAEHAPALSPPNEPHTAFTGELIRLLDEGIEDGPDLLDVDTLYLTLHQRLKAKRRPEPQQRINDHGAQIVLARNRRRSQPDAARTGRLAPARTLVGPPDRLRGLPTALDALTGLIDGLRDSGEKGEADTLLQVLGRHRDAQEVAATLASFAYLQRDHDISPVLDGLAVRNARDCIAVVDVLHQIGAREAIEAVLGREAQAPAERAADVVGRLAASASEKHLDHLLDAVIKSGAGKPDRVIDIISHLLLHGRAEEADRLVDRCRTGLNAAEIAAIADALRDAGREKAAFRLYPAAIEVLADRLPDQIATLAGGLRRHGHADSAMALAVDATTQRHAAADRADLLIAFDAVDGLDEEVVRITGIFADDLDESELEELPDALRERGGKTVNLYLAMLSRLPIEAILQQVNGLARHGRPVEAIAILEAAGATRHAAELDTLTAGLTERPEFHHHKHVFAAVTSRPDCTVELYRRLHRRTDGRFRILRAELVRQSPLVLFDVVIKLVWADDATLGEDLLRYAAGESQHVLADKIIEFATAQNAEVLVLAAVGLPDLKRIIHALRRKGLYLDYRSADTAGLLRHQSRRTTVVVAALYTADQGAPAESLVRQLSAMRPDWVAYLIEVLVWPGDGVGRPRAEADLNGPKSETVTARAILRVAAAYRPDRAASFVAALHSRRLREVIPYYLTLWSNAHPTGVDAFILGSALCRRSAPGWSVHWNSRILHGRAYLPQAYWADAIATAVSEVLHHASGAGKAIHRYPVPDSMIQRLYSVNLFTASDYCLLVVEFRGVLGNYAVFTDCCVRYGRNSRITYAELARAELIEPVGRQVLLRRGGAIVAVLGNMRTDDDAAAVARILQQVRRRIIEVKERYAQLESTARRQVPAPRARRQLSRPT